ncbi:LppM family (lipo)protein [Cellulomonas pakistanensis]|uniref:LppM domain-containing protein n=1 Tax=Cellulomonas pakistanensis TaxID=992287 RepID=A0A919P5W8_9CELL|nr:hypothetical protein [Cellulomonas pakistanensis]GIG34686.1 hypothetical protein Cpa01nite_00670 [Cellulomonas pakistanensis]
MTTRPVRALAVALLAVAVLSGCFRYDMQVVVGEDDTVSGSYVIAIDGRAMGLTEAEVEEFLATEAPETGGPFDPDAGLTTDQERYVDGDLVGTRYSFEDVPFDVFNGDDTALSRTGTGWELSGTIPVVLDEETADEAPASGGEVRFAITFPGDVVDTNGEVDPGDPRTVRWTSDGKQPVELHAVATEPGPPWLALGAVGGAGLLVGGGVLALVLVLVRRRRRAAAQAAAAWSVQPAPVSAGWPTEPGVRTQHAWQPDPPAGLPPGAVPRQPPPGLPPYGT